MHLPAANPYMPTDKHQEVNGMAKRKLSADEKERIAEDRRIKEVTAHPDKMISVHVEDVTDEIGAPVVTVHYIGDPEDSRRRPDR